MLRQHGWCQGTSMIRLIRAQQTPRQTNQLLMISISMMLTMLLLMMIRIRRCRLCKSGFRNVCRLLHFFAFRSVCRMLRCLDVRNVCHLCWFALVRPSPYHVTSCVRIALRCVASLCATRSAPVACADRNRRLLFDLL